MIRSEAHHRPRPRRLRRVRLLERRHHAPAGPRRHARSPPPTRCAACAGDAALRSRCHRIGRRPVVLVGHSYGGMVITQAAAENQARRRASSTSPPSSPDTGAERLRPLHERARQHARGRPRGVPGRDRRQRVRDPAGAVPPTSSRRTCRTTSAGLMAATQRPVTQAHCRRASPTDRPAWKDIPSWYRLRRRGPQHPGRRPPGRCRARLVARHATEIAGASHAISGLAARGRRGHIADGRQGLRRFAGDAACQATVWRARGRVRPRGIISSPRGARMPLPRSGRARSPQVSSSVAYIDAGDPSAEPVVLLHGFPYDIHSYVEVIPLLVEAGYPGARPLPARAGRDALPRPRAPMRSGQQAALGADVDRPPRCTRPRAADPRRLRLGRACRVRRRRRSGPSASRASSSVERLSHPGHRGSRASRSSPDARGRLLVLLVLRHRTRRWPVSQRTAARSPR